MNITPAAREAAQRIQRLAREQDDLLTDGGLAQEIQLAINEAVGELVAMLHSTTIALSAESTFRRHSDIWETLNINRTLANAEELLSRHNRPQKGGDEPSPHQVSHKTNQSPEHRGSHAPKAAERLKCIHGVSAGEPCKKCEMHEPAEQQQQPVGAISIVEQINTYLSHGGLFNPEQMDHEDVRDLLIEARDHLTVRHQSVPVSELNETYDVLQECFSKTHWFPLYKEVKRLQTLIQNAKENSK